MFTKAQLVDAVAEERALSRGMVEEVLDTAISQIGNVLASGDFVQLTPLGQFARVQTGTGEFRVHFAPARELAEVVNAPAD